MLSSDERYGCARFRKPVAVVVLLVAVVALAALLPAPAAARDGSLKGSIGPSAGAGLRFQLDPTKTWEFERFDVSVKINTDGSLTVRETQVVNFTGSFTFLNRDLTASKASFTDGRTYGEVRFEDIKVYDLNGRLYHGADVQTIKGGKRVHIVFSATNEQRGWTVEYRMTGAIIYAKDYDRLYFNTVSTDRSVPIKSSKTTVAPAARSPSSAFMKASRVSGRSATSSPFCWRANSSAEADAGTPWNGTPAPCNTNAGTPKRLPLSASLFKYCV